MSADPLDGKVVLWGDHRPTMKDYEKFTTFMIISATELRGERTFTFEGDDANPEQMVDVPVRGIVLEFPHTTFVRCYS